MRKKEEVSKVTVVANVALDYNSLTLCAYRPVVFIYRILKLTCVSCKILLQPDCSCWVEYVYLKYAMKEISVFFNNWKSFVTKQDFIWLCDKYNDNILAFDIKR